jgi:hypothetical protein
MNGNSLRQTLFKVCLVLGLGLSLAACTWSMAGGMLGAILTVLVSASLIIGAGTTTAGCDDPGANTGTENTDAGPSDTGNTADQDTKVGPCLSFVPDVGESEVESDVYVGPCLSAPLPDVGPDSEEPDTLVGPCLEPPAPDISELDSEDDIYVGPCLSPPEPDISEPDDTADVFIGPCLSQPLPDIIEPEPDSKDSETSDVYIGPCLSPPAPDISEPDSFEKDVELQPCLSLPPPDDEAHVDFQPARQVATRGDARQAIRERLAAQGVIPADVADRFRDRKGS